MLSNVKPTLADNLDAARAAGQRSRRQNPGAEIRMQPAPKGATSSGSVGGGGGGATTTNYVSSSSSSQNDSGFVGAIVERSSRARNLSKTTTKSSYNNQQIELSRSNHQNNQFKPKMDKKIEENLEEFENDDFNGDDDDDDDFDYAYQSRYRGGATRDNPNDAGLFAPEVDDDQTNKNSTIQSQQQRIDHEITIRNKLIMQHHQRQDHDQLPEFVHRRRAVNRKDFHQEEEEEEREQEQQDNDRRQYNEREEEEEDAINYHQNGHFDPYSVYGEEDNDEEDVWYSEDRLFEVSSHFDSWPYQLLKEVPYLFCFFVSLIASRHNFCTIIDKFNHCATTMIDDICRCRRRRCGHQVD